MKNYSLPSLSFFMLCAAISISLIGCGNSTSATDENGGNNGGNNGGGTGDPPPNEVVMNSQSFSPNSIEVEVGTTVTWVNESSATHTVTSGTDGQHDDKFDSGNVSPGEEFSFTFDETGEYPYYCVPHLSAGMTGTVTVVSSSGDAGY